jgi:Flp pilus assembly protein TadG
MQQRTYPAWRPRLRGVRSGGVRARHAQRGVYAIEFAFVFLLFFAMLYAIIAYGVLLTLRGGLQNAAEEGARAGLRYQVVAAGGSQLPLRRAKAAEVAASRVTGWFVTAPAVLSQICRPESGVCGDTPACGADWATRCQLKVTITASGLDQMMPMLRFALPTTLTGQASMLLDGRAP